MSLIVNTLAVTKTIPFFSLYLNLNLNLNFTMTRKKKEYIPESFAHVYQRATSRFVLFYTIEDYLMFLMTFSSFSRKHPVEILALCPMVDHIHFLCRARSINSIAEFVHDYTIAFSKEYNEAHGLKGSLVESSYGIACKIGEKKQRTAVAYVYNNPVEKKLCGRCEDYRWNFLAYAKTSHPFSEKIVLKRITGHTRLEIKLIKDYSSKAKVIPRTILRGLFEKKGKPEAEQLIDLIVSSYMNIDFKTTIELYGSYQKMLTAINSNTGSEYDIKEDYNPYSDKAYIRMSRWMVKKYGREGIKVIFTADTELKEDLLNHFIKELKVTPYQALKFLRIKDEEVIR